MRLEFGDFSSRQELQLVRRAIEGDTTAIDALFGRNKTRLLSIASRVLRNREDAEDAVQEGLLSAYQNLHRFEGKSRFSTWLTRIIINASLMRLRSNRSRAADSLEQWCEEQNGEATEGTLAGEDLSPDDAYTGVELLSIIENELAGLSPILRSAFLLREGQHLSVSEAASRLGIPESTLKARVWRARHELASRLVPVLRGDPWGAKRRHGSEAFVLAGAD